ncbi:MAG: hypothetical protein RMK29_02365 [Myxococcales bacterium]|nr:hypothetical protein [Myxococcales bacterium]
MWVGNKESYVRAGVLLLALWGAVSVGSGGQVWAQALPPGQEGEGGMVQRPPFYGLSLDLIGWNQTGLWAGGGAYRNDFGFLIMPTWAIGRRFIGRGPFRSLTLQGRFIFNVPVAGFDESGYAGDAPPWSEQQPCALGRSESLRFVDLPRCDWGRGSRRVDYSDLTLILANPRIYTIPRLEVRIDPSVILTLPVSAQSRLATLILQGVLQLGVARSFWKGRLDVGYTYGLGKGFFRYATGGVVYDSRGADVPFAQDVLARGLSNFYADAGGGAILCQGFERCRNPTLFMQHTFRATVSVLEPLSITVIYRIGNTYFRNPAGCSETLSFDHGPPLATCGEGAAIQTPSSFWTDNQLLWAMVNYQPLPWLGISLSYITAAPLWQYARSTPDETLPDAEAQFAPTRSYRQGIISVDANDFTSISLSLDVTVDALAKKFLKKESSGGRP